MQWKQLDVAANEWVIDTFEKGANDNYVSESEARVTFLAIIESPDLLFVEKTRKEKEKEIHGYLVDAADLPRKIR